MTSAEALTRAKRAVVAGRVLYTRHARRRMQERNATVSDVERAIETSTSASRSSSTDKWKLEGGHDIDGDPLSVVVAFEDDLTIVVTVM